MLLNKRKRNSTPFVGKRSVQIEAFKNLYLIATLKAVTYEAY